MLVPSNPGRNLIEVFAVRFLRSDVSGVSPTFPNFNVANEFVTVISSVAGELHPNIEIQGAGGSDVKRETSIKFRPELMSFSGCHTRNTGREDYYLSHGPYSVGIFRCYIVYPNRRVWLRISSPLAGLHSCPLRFPIKWLPGAGLLPQQNEQLPHESQKEPPLHHVPSSRI